MDSLLIGCCFVYSVGFLPQASLKAKTAFDKFILWLIPSIIALSAPFLSSNPTNAFSLSMVSLPIVFRSADIAFQRIPDSEIVYKKGLLWRILFFVLPDLALHKAQHVRPSVKSLSSGILVSFIPLVLLYLLHSIFKQAIETQILLRVSFWALLVIIQIPAFYGVLNAILSYFALDVSASKAFDSPVCATSPNDFWSHRWNLVFRNFAWRHVFIPLKPRFGPSFAAFAVYTVSGIMHEYVMAVSLRSSYWTNGCGQFLVFFWLQAIICGIEKYWTKRYPQTKHETNEVMRIVKILMTLIWLSITSFGAISVLRSILFPAYHQYLPAIF